MKKNNNHDIKILYKKSVFVNGGGYNRKSALVAAAFVICLFGSSNTYSKAADPSPTLGDNSGYSLKPSEPGDSNVWAFTYDSESQTLSTHYYQIDIKRDSQGTGEKIQYYKWEKGPYGGDILVKSDEPTEYKVYYDPKIDHYEVGSSLHIAKGATRSDIKMDFIGNHITTAGSHYGNGMHNEGTITNVIGDFVHNYSQIKDGTNNGGALYNTGSITNLQGNFIGNFISSPSDSNGGAIRNEGTINTIKGHFISNYAVSSGDHNGYAGAIYNTSKIDTIVGDFIDNQTYADKFGTGGAIFNNKDIGSITGDFVGNKARGLQGAGGAIFDISGIKELNSNFIHNYAESSGDKVDDEGIRDVHAEGGALYEYSRTNDTEINGSFYGNYVQADHHEGHGGGIFAKGGGSGKIAVNGNFYHNYAHGVTGAMGGAIYNSDKATADLNGNEYFLNYAKTDSGNALGGAIYNEGTINNLKNVTFVQNFAQSDKGNAHGGAIWTNQDLKISADGAKSEFTNNYVKSAETTTNEAIYVDNNKTLTLESQNGGEILFNDIINGSDAYKISMTGDNTSSLITLNNEIINANAVLDNVTLKLGANADIFKSSALTVNSGVVDTADSKYTDYNFKELNSNNSSNFNIDISISKDKNLDDADTFTVNSSEKGSVINISSIVVDALNDYKESAAKGEEHIIQIIKSTDGNIQLRLDGKIQTVTEASAVMSSDLILAEELGLCKTDTENDSIKLVGWRDNLAAWAELEVDEDTAKIFTINGTTQTLSRKISGLNGKNISIIGEGSSILDVNEENLFSDIKNEQNVTLSNLSLKNADKVKNSGSLTFENLIFEDSSKVTNNKDLTIKGKTNINGTITSESKGNLNLDNSNTEITGKVSNQKIDNISSNTTLINVNDFQNNELSMNGGSFNIRDLGLHELHLTDFNLNDGDINIDSVDVDLANKTMGKITSDKYKIDENFHGRINVKDMNITNDSKDRKTVIEFADNSIKNYVTSNVTEAPTTGQKWETYSPIYKYTVEYSKDGTYGDNGYFVFSRGGSNSGNASDSFNPAVLPSTVASQAGSYATMNQAFNYAFEHADTFSTLPTGEKYAMMNANKYAINESVPLNGHINEINSNGFWLKPYATFENIPLKNGPKVDTVTYGTLVGIDGDIKNLKRGWSTVSTAYMGYNGSSQHYNGVSTNQNGGLLGLTQTFYKDNFFTALTASIGASVADSSTMYGTEDFTSLLSGVASKSGYSFEFKNGKFVIQPSLLVSYTFVNTFDYTNAAGVKIDSDPLHAIQVKPNLKFVMNTETGWQPYIFGGFVYNVMDKTETVAIDGITDDVRLPNMSVKPYAEYGLGIQKRWKDKYTGYAQTMVRNGGRNGVALSFGFRIALDNNTEKVKLPNKKIKTASDITKNTKSQKTAKERGINKFLLKFSNFFCQPSTQKTAKI